MKLIDALARLKVLDTAAFSTTDAAAHLRIGRGVASKTLDRLKQAGHLLRLRRGVWGFPDKMNGLMLPQHLTAPFPSYISLQTALYHHGMISQMAAVTYAMSLARTRVYDTPLGRVSIHHVVPEFFFGFEQNENGIWMALPEKALLDIFYLSPAKSGLFKTLPEVEFPKNFSIRSAKNMIGKIKSEKRRKIVTTRFEKWIGKK